MIDESESVIFIANISVIGISVILHIGAPLFRSTQSKLMIEKSWLIYFRTEVTYYSVFGTETK